MATATLPITEAPNATEKVVSVTRISVEEFIASKDLLERILSPGHFIELLREGRVIAEICVPWGSTPSRISANASFPDFLQRLRALWGETPMETDITQVIGADRDGR